MRGSQAVFRLGTFSYHPYIIYDYEIPEGADIDIDVDYTPAE